MAAIAQSPPRPVQTPTPAAGRVRTPLFIFGVALSLVAFLIMFAFGIVYVGRSQSGATVKVVAAARDIGAREPITLDMVTIGTFPTSAAPTGKTFAKVTDLIGFAAVVPIYKGQAITDNIVTISDQISTSQSSYLPIPAGYVVMTIPDSELVGVAGYVAQGDYIDVIATVNTAQFSPANPRTVTKTVFSKLYVMRVGPQSVVPRQGQPQGVSSSITVLLTECDAQYLVWLTQNATLKYTLLSYHDYGTPNLQPDPSCPGNAAPALIGPAQVDQKWDFTKG
ncbi:MAG TPA: Flp pilus assembly protein CpaB [Candidatus Dormibacteraeota bacterium]|nr:Flp pilus assembly protein CpaB [Candidatus Dormibacteraeota bacterium]